MNSWYEGAAACRDCVPRDKNPYSSSEKRNKWFEGWDIANGNKLKALVPVLP